MDRPRKKNGLASQFVRIHDEWKDRTDAELEKFILDCIVQTNSDENDQPALPTAKTEGSKKVFISVRREQNPHLREQAIRIHGLECIACCFDFEAFYGPLGHGFAEVHHVMPLAEAETRETDPQTDLAVLCANCHRMVHRQRGICLSVDEPKERILNANGKSS